MQQQETMQKGTKRREQQGREGRDLWEQLMLLLVAAVTLRVTAWVLLLSMLLLGQQVV
jgi:hypothetical protein